jgi:hypothetical protein
MPDRFFIAPYEENSGLQSNVKPWLIPDEAFSQLNNAYVFRGRVRKRFGSRWIGENSLVSRLRINIGTITAGTLAGNLRTILVDAGMPTGIGQSFSVGTIIFTVFNPALGDQQMLRSDNSVAPATYNLTNSDFNITGVALPDGTDVFFYPNLPVMGLLTYEQSSINDEFVIAFDTRYAYQYNGGWLRLANTGAAAVWTGDNSEFFWATTWRGANASDRVFFVTNFNIPDGIRYFFANTWNFFNYYFSKGASLGNTSGIGGAAGVAPAPRAIGQTFVIGNTLFTVVVANGALAVSSLTTDAPVGTGTFNIATGAYVFVGAQINSPIFYSDGNLINTARIIVPFKNRLLLFNTVEAGISYSNRCRYSQIGSPLDPAAWFEDIPGRGNTIDASTSEAIITVEFVKDRLIVFFERSTWELVYTGNQVQPFTWQQINTELGAESTFSIVPFDKICIGVGNVGIHACNGSNVERIDEKIPDTVFEIHNNDQGVFRVYGIRDYYVEMVYWTFPSIEANTTFPYPSRVLIFNYKTGTWAFNDDSITCFGYFQPVSGITWDSVTVTWDDSTTWDSGSIQAKFRQVIGGNQEGYTFICDADEATNAAVLQITNITLVGVTTTLTVIQHNISLQDGADNDTYIYIQGATWSDDSNSLNNKIFQVIRIIDADTFEILVEPEDQFTGVYSGGGLISRVSNISIKTKEYNFYAKQGRNAYISRVDFMVDKTSAGQIQAEFFVSTSDVPLLADSFGDGELLGTGTLDTFPYIELPIPIFPYTSVKAPIPFEKNATRLWHPVYFDADGEVIQLQLVMNAAQMKNVAIRECDFVLHAMCISAQPTSYRFQ